METTPTFKTSYEQCKKINHSPTHTDINYLHQQKWEINQTSTIKQPILQIQTERLKSRSSLYRSPRRESPNSRGIRIDEVTGTRWRRRRGPTGVPPLRLGLGFWAWVVGVEGSWDGEGVLSCGPWIVLTHNLAHCLIGTLFFVFGYFFFKKKRNFLILLRGRIKSRKKKVFFYYESF